MIKIAASILAADFLNLGADVERMRQAGADYLHCDAYGALLLDCFACCRTRLPQGYAAFHLPWVVEWYTAARQYKKVCELLTEFPDIRI